MPAVRPVPKGIAVVPQRVVPKTELPPVEPVEFQSVDPNDARAFNATVPFSTLPNPAARPFRFSGSTDARLRAIDCLAAAELYEAGDDSEGERAVAQVVLNRVRHPAFPKSVCGVVFQGSERSTGCQFTFSCDGALQRWSPSEAAWDRARDVARMALNGAVYKPVGHATHYHTDWVVPYWSSSLEKITEVGTHLFFRWAGWWGTPPASNGRSLREFQETADPFGDDVRAEPSGRGAPDRQAAQRTDPRRAARADVRTQARPESRCRAARAQARHQAGAEAAVRTQEPGLLRQPRRGDGELARPSVRETVRGRSGRRVRLVTVAVGVAAAMLVAASPAGAQDVSINFGQGTGLTERVIQMIALLTVLSLAPSILVMMTSFTRIVVVLSLLRTALGTATAPPNAVIVSLALFLTAFVMAPALQTSYDTGIKPLIANQITPEQAFDRGTQPLRAFMQKNVREADLKLFMDMAKEPAPAKPEDMSLRILVPAFMISELKRAFEIGFLLFLPFLIIDLVVASVLMSMGMMMLPPVVVSLPFKLIFFVLVDGWSLVAGSLVQSYGGG